MVRGTGTAMSDVNVLLSSGTSMFQGIVERMTKELAA